IGHRGRGGVGDRGARRGVGGGKRRWDTAISWNGSRAACRRARRRCLDRICRSAAPMARSERDDLDLAPQLYCHCDAQSSHQRAHPRFRRDPEGDQLVHSCTVSDRHAPLSQRALGSCFRHPLLRGALVRDAAHDVRICCCRPRRQYPCGAARRTRDCALEPGGLHHRRSGGRACRRHRDVCRPRRRERISGGRLRLRRYPDCFPRPPESACHHPCCNSGGRRLGKRRPVAAAFRHAGRRHCRAAGLHLHSCSRRQYALWPLAPEPRMNELELGWWGVLIAVIGGAIRISTPYLFVSLGETLTEKSGRVNLGLEGTLVMGAMSGFAVGYLSGSPWLGVIAAGLAGSGLGLLHAAVCHLPRVNDIVGGWSAYPSVRAALEINALFIVGLILAPVLYWGLRHTRWGLVLRTVGDSADAAHALGYSIERVRTLATMAGGFLAGVGGSFLSLYYPGNWNEGLSSGQGLMAVALVIFARWNPLSCFWVSLLFGGAGALGPALQSVGIAQGYYLFNAAPYVLTLIILTWSSSTRHRLIGAPSELTINR